MLKKISLFILVFLFVFNFLNSNLNLSAESQTEDSPRIMYWWGKVNQHFDLKDKIWKTDPDGVSGADLDKLTYCKKWYPNTVKVEDYKDETINTWRERGNKNAWTSTKMSIKCIQEDQNDNSPRIMYWWGKVNQHFDQKDKTWKTDPDGVSGADLDKLTYCKKWYPKTVKVKDYKQETIDTWRERGNKNAHSSTKPSFKCVQPGDPDDDTLIIVDENVGCGPGNTFNTITGKECPLDKKEDVNADITPRIMYWWGKVNQHFDLKDKIWKTDPDGTSGANLDKLAYCKKWYPDLNITTTEDYKNETTDTWKAAGNTGSYTSTKMSTKCISQIIPPAPVLVPISGGWSEWENSGSCINSKQTQIRLCNNPVPADGGADCVGPSIQEISCTVVVPVNGGWSSWSNLGSCNNGIQQQTRTCTNPAPANGGSVCLGESSRNLTCSVVIPVNGGWSEWKNNGKCKSGNQPQIRTCTNPAPANGGATCVGDSSRNLPCAVTMPINGGWSSWIDSGNCTNGLQSQIRICNSPTPSNGGKMCSGASSKQISCAVDDIVVIDNNPVPPVSGNNINGDGSTNDGVVESLEEENLDLVNISFYRDLRQGLSGDDVKLLQKILKDKGYDIGSIDGIYGEKTRLGVEKYQNDNGLKISGFIDNDDVLDSIKLELLD